MLVRGVYRRLVSDRKWTCVEGRHMGEVDVLLEGSKPDHAFRPQIRQAKAREPGSSTPGELPLKLCT